jgi:hypothetical protein
MVDLRGFARKIHTTRGEVLKEPLRQNGFANGPSGTG